MKNVKRIDSVFVPVTDLQRSEEWYMKVFPFRVVYRSGDGNYVGFRFNEEGEEVKTALTIFKTDKLPERIHSPFNFYIEEVDGFHTFLVENGYNVGEIHSADGMRFFDFYDPDGNTLGVVEF